MTGEDTNMIVMVRIRPFNDREKSMGCRETVRAASSNLVSFDPPSDDGIPSFSTAAYGHSGSSTGSSNTSYGNSAKRARDLTFAFDYVFDPFSTQEQVFQPLQSLVFNVLDGINATVCAYGATSAGKTHTMVGTESSPGIMVLAIRELYDRARQLETERSVTIAISYLEVYNETIRDLIRPSGPLALREDGGAVTVAGLSVHTPLSAEELFSMLTAANANRTQHPTDANANSSRSHAVLQVHVRQRNRTAGIQTDFRMAKLTLIDLAGSERATVTTNSGARLREGANINRSLLALGNCINALVEKSKSRSSAQMYVPYRDSKLTRLLKDSLGGNSKTVMIANVSPASWAMEDTHNTLVYASRARSIKNTVVKNETKVEFHVSRYVSIIDELRKEVGELKERLACKDAEMSAMVVQQQQQQQQQQKDPEGLAPVGYASPLVKKIMHVMKKQHAVLQQRGLLDEPEPSAHDLSSVYNQALLEWSAAQETRRSNHSSSMIEEHEQRTRGPSETETLVSPPRMSAKRPLESDGLSTPVGLSVRRLRATFEEGATPAKKEKETGTPQKEAARRNPDGSPAVARFAAQSLLGSIMKQTAIAAVPAAKKSARVSFVEHVMINSYSPQPDFSASESSSPATSAHSTPTNGFRGMRITETAASEPSAILSPSMEAQSLSPVLARLASKLANPAFNSNNNEVVLDEEMDAETSSEGMSKWSTHVRALSGTPRKSFPLSAVSGSEASQTDDLNSSFTLASSKLGDAQRIAVETPTSLMKRTAIRESHVTTVSTPSRVSGTSTPRSLHASRQSIAGTGIGSGLPQASTQALKENDSSAVSSSKLLKPGFRSGTTASLTTGAAAAGAPLATSSSLMNSGASRAMRPDGMAKPVAKSAAFSGIKPAPRVTPAIASVGAVKKPAWK